MTNDDDDLSGHETVWSEVRTYSVDDEPQDPIKPVEIDHAVDGILAEGPLGDRYSHLYYHFEKDGAYCMAHAMIPYCDTVNIWGPYTDRENRISVEATDLFEAVKEYLKRRYMAINVFREKSYETIWKHPEAEEMGLPNAEDIE